jgi:hypothetical protein
MGQAEQALQAAVSAVEPLRARQELHNRRTAPKWDLYEEHRNNVTSVLLQQQHAWNGANGWNSGEADARDASHAGAPTLALLGAGNLNDIDLRKLLRPSAAGAGAGGFSHLSLIDLDLAAMRNGVERQVLHRGLDKSLASDPARLSLFAADVTGSFERPLSEWKRRKVRHDAAVAAGEVGKDVLFPPVEEVDAWIASLQVDPSSASFSRYAGLPSAISASGEETVAAASSIDAVEVDVHDDEPESPQETQKKDAVASSATDAATSPASSLSSSASPSSSPSATLAAAAVEYDIVASVCLLSQLLDMYMSVITDAHPRFLAGTLALRDAHVALMLHLLRPGGRGVLITDVVASTSAPQLRQTPHAQLHTLLPDLVAQSNFFTGCNPRAIEKRLASTTAPFATQIDAASVQLLLPPHSPWLWNIGGPEDKRFLVYAITFQKKRA